VEVTSVAKFNNGERSLVKNLVATLSLKRISDKEIIEFIFHQTGKMISERTLYELRQSIKRDSYQWYCTMREGQYEYLHEFKERINEIVDLQKMHHEIIIRNRDNPGIQQTSLAELHRLSITLSNLYDVAPTIINNGPSLPATSEDSSSGTEITV
jgi:hypothetical protein